MFLLEDYINFIDDFGNKSTIKYLLLKNQIYGNTVYGIRLEKLDSEKNIEDFEEVINITDNFDFAKTIFDSLKNYLVTPTSLINILDDFITLNEF